MTGLLFIPPHSGLRLAVGLAALLLGAGLAPAQNAGGETRVNAAVTTPPIPEVAVLKVRASLEQFQRLLAMSPAERDKALAVKPERARNFLAAELKRYDAMDEAGRRTALQAERVAYYLKELVRRPSNEWENALLAIPEEDRPPVEARLRRMERLTPELRDAVLNNDRAVRYVLQLGGPGNTGPALPAGASLPGKPQSAWETQIEKWRALPQADRQKLFDQFGKFLELRPDEQQRVLATLPAKDRQETAALLQTIGKLPADQRSACIESFDKVVGSNSSSTADFLLTVQRWQAMSEQEKQVWKHLTKTIPPGVEPLPPGVKPTPPPTGTMLPPPPLPGGR